ncbi:MAG: hypothetical protein ACRD96_22670, partial [Bryobacteraceae bacterium]
MMTRALLCLVALAIAFAQTSEEGIRQLWNSNFLQKRPAAKTPASKAATPKPVKPPVYKSVGPAPATKASAADTLLGVTLWRLRKPRAADDPNSRLLILESESDPGADFVPERLAVDTPLAEGDRVRLTVEVPRGGYLYVIDREQYADGTLSPPYLIYPNFKTRPGDNAIAAGRIVEV